MSLTAKSGYKQSEIGEIPEVWDCLTVQQLIDKGAISGHLDGNHGELYPRSHEFKNFGVPYIGANNFYSGQVDLQGCKFLSEERAVLFKKGVAKDGDVLFAHNATVGPVAKLKTSLKYVILSTTATYFRVNGTLLNNDYLMHYMRSELFSNQYSAIMSQSTRNQVPITAQRKLFVVVPPIEEQSKIASSLSVVDALINNLDQLITKKRDIQQATMQQLLTGQRRLPGFSGEWEVKRLGDLCTLGIGRTPSRINDAYWGRGYKWLSIADLKGKIIAESSEEITELAAKQIPLIKKGTLLMSFKLSIGRLAFAGCDLFTNEAICSFNELKANADWLYYALQRVDFSLYGKQAVKGFTLNKASLQLVEVAIPTMEEQTAIANILSDMDTELAALEVRRDKARHIKQGMMQELLTGRTRLI
ncbi:TPA: restriction endonuclease subunit S [Pseudomonas aeruginosa]